jgi:hypothetical protein
MTLRRFAAVAALPFALACGSSNPTAAPEPSPTPTAAPTPAPSATPRAFVCPLPSLPDHQQPCPKLQPRFSVEVLTSIDQVVNEQPQLFDFNDHLGLGYWKVRDRQAYLLAVTRAINQKGLCTTISPEEIGVKNSNDFNEQWNVITGRDYIRRAYITTCIPSAF